MKVYKFIFLIILTLLLSTGYQVSGSTLDQSQDQDNYGFVFDQNTPRWQEFRPYTTSILQIDVSVSKVGNPGSLILTLQYNGSTIWSDEMIEANVVSGWNSVQLNLTVTQGELYRLILTSTIPTPNVDNRYWWDGHVNANYSVGLSDLSYSWPTFAYTFRTYGEPVSQNIKLDQSQTIENNGYVIDLNTHRYQEFVPDYNDIGMLSVYLSKQGNSGSLILAIEDTSEELWRGYLASNSISTGWVNFTLATPLSVVPGETYRLVLSTDQATIDVNNRYWWRGNSNSAYPGETDLKFSWPNYDFAFMTWGVNSFPSISNITHSPEILNDATTIEVNTTVSDIQGVASVELFVSVDNGDFTSHPMSNVIDNIFSYILSLNENVLLKYYIKATNIEGAVRIDDNQTSYYILIKEISNVVPTIIAASDIVYDFNTTGHTISWEVTDDNPKNYTITKDGIVISSEILQNGTIEVSVDGLEIGVYIYELLVYDEDDHTNSDVVLVSVIEPESEPVETDPVITPPSDVKSSDPTITGDPSPIKSDEPEENNSSSSVPPLPVPAMSFVVAVSSLGLMIAVNIKRSSV